MVAHVLRKCEEKNRPVNPGILRLASALLPTRDDQLAQNNNARMLDLFHTG